MALSSMTGFARSHGASGPYTFEWELKSVNAKGFDLKIWNTSGQLLKHIKNIDTQYIDIQDINDSFLIFVFEKEGQRIIKKIVVQ